MTDAPLIDSLTAAVQARPDDHRLRLHLAELLITAGQSAAAIGHLATVLQADPLHPAAQRLMVAAVSPPPAPATTPTAGTASPDTAPDGPTGNAGSDTAAPHTTTPHTAAPHNTTGPDTTGPDTSAQDTAGPGRAEQPRSAEQPAAEQPATEQPATEPTAGEGAAQPDGGGRSVDWTALEREFDGVVPPRYAGGDPPDPERPSPGEDRAAHSDGTAEPVQGDDDGIVEVERSTMRLADVGGMQAVKERLELAFLGPLRNPQLRSMYGKSLRGGLLLYGPPGCGKTFLARALAGELGAAFISLSIVDVLSMWIGSSERNLHEIFQAARRNAPCVLFLDEIDALGHKRSQINSSWLRTLANQLLTELDGVGGDNDGVFVLAATNAPWDVDPALRRPGRLDRMALVLPPDEPARSAIVDYHLRDRPIAGIDLRRIVAATANYSGADLAHLVETAAEHALADSVRSGVIRMIEQRDFDRALTEVRPSTGPWFATARNVAQFANDGGDYDELIRYLKQRKLL